jgi:diguanylate cyclase (GGDEF)-like protein
MQTFHSRPSPLEPPPVLTALSAKQQSLMLLTFGTATWVLSTSLMALLSPSATLSIWSVCFSVFGFIGILLLIQRQRFVLAANLLVALTTIFSAQVGNATLPLSLLFVVLPVLLAAAILPTLSLCFVGCVHLGLLGVLTAFPAYDYLWNEPILWLTASLIIMIMLVGTTRHRLATFELHSVRLECQQVEATNRRLEARLAERSADVRAAFDDLERLAYYDPLTGLGNRRMLQMHLAQATARMALNDGSLSMLYLNLNRFKTVNDTLGQQAGDELLINVARRLRTGISGDPLLSRVGSDEFAILLPNTDEQAAIVLAQQVANVLKPPFIVSGQTLYITGHIGVACANKQQATPDSLMQRADVALYRARTGGKPFHVYHPDIQVSLRERMTLEQELRRAITNNELTLFYQPLLNMQTNQVERFEALVRWQHPERGLLAPGAFIPIAEESDLITLLDRWVLREVCQQLATRREQIPQQVALNLSARSLQDTKLLDDVYHMLRTTGAPANQIAVEMTESIAIRDVETTLHVVRGLKALGISVILDDVGSGYAALSYLRQLPIDVMKIDRSFVSGIGREVRDEAMLEALITLGQSLNLVVVAEGVETEAQLAWLKRTKVDFVQGYLIGRPAPLT